MNEQVQNMLAKSYEDQNAPFSYDDIAKYTCIVILHDKHDGAFQKKLTKKGASDRLEKA
jgi:hypothetical protein